MVKLTEDMVIARSKGSELHNIKKLNCWGSELSDVSVVRKLPNVEVLSLSVNKISTLEDFMFCNNLQELYIRKNCIDDINEVLFLRNLPKLKSLWLSDNPCADFNEYRLTVLRTLPHLQKLDNINVESEEVQHAVVAGRNLPFPDSAIRGQEAAEVSVSSSSEEQYAEAKSRSTASNSPTQPQMRKNELNGSHRDDYDYNESAYDDNDDRSYIRSQSYIKEEDNERRRISQPAYNDNSNVNPYTQRRSHIEIADDCSSVSSNQQSSTSPRRRSYAGTPSGRQPPRRQSPSRRTSQVEPQMESVPAFPERQTFSRASSEYMYETRTENPNAFDAHNANYIRETNNSNRQRSGRDPYREQSWTSDADTTYSGHEESVCRNSDYPASQRGEYSKMNRYIPEGRVVQNYRSPVSDMKAYPRNGNSNHYETSFHRGEQQQVTSSRNSGNIERPSPNRPYPTRPKTRNANILSAALSLIKELDYCSLEVVEMAVRCRMDELDL